MKHFIGAVLMTIPLAAQSASPAADNRGWLVLEAALKAAGGREKLMAVKDMTFEMQSHIVTPRGEFDVTSKNFWVLPDTVRQEMTMPFGQILTAYSKSGGWQRGPQGHRDIERDQLRRTQDHLARVNALFRPPSDPASVRWLKEDAMDGRPCDVIELTKLGVRLFVDRQSGDVLKRAYQVENPGGAMSNVEEILSDYRSIDGLRMNFKVREMRDGKLAREGVTRTVKINSGLKAEDLLNIAPQ